jgi:hypothetical protein
MSIGISFDFDFGWGFNRDKIGRTFINRQSQAKGAAKRI